MDIKHRAEGNKGTFYFEENGEQLAEAEYSRSGDGTITIYHTGVNQSLRGRGVGEKLIASAVEFARSEGVKIDPTCSYARKVMGQNAEYSDVLV